MSNSTAPAGPPSSAESSPFSSSGPEPSPNQPSSPSSAPPPETPSSTPAPPESPPPSQTSAAPSAPEPEPAPAPPATTTEVTSVVTALASDSPTAGPVIITLTSTADPPPAPSSRTSTLPSATPQRVTSTVTPLPSQTSVPREGGGGLSNGGRIAIAVVSSVVGVALLVLALLFLWRRRKQRKAAEELARRDVFEYGYNPNSDPRLPAAAGTTSSGGDDNYEMREDDTNGYRGWGTTPANRKLSTTLSNGTGPIGLAVSDGGAQVPAALVAGAPASPTQPVRSEAHSGEPLLNSPARPHTAESEVIGELGGAPVAGPRKDINRGSSNASSSYSAANRSDGSSEGPVPAPNHPANYYVNDGLQVDDGSHHHNPYGNGSHGGGQPVIRDVQARRNTRIETPPVMPPQGNAGIAQNF